MIEELIIELEANKKITDTSIYLDNEKFQIRKKKEKLVMCKKFLQFGHLKKIF